MNMRASIGMAALATALAIGGAHAQNASHDSKSQAAAKPSLQVATPNPTEAMQDLRMAVRELREASVLLLKQKDQSGARDEAVEAAQDAIGEAQRAMTSLPSAYRSEDGKTRQATDWPAAASRLDRASQALERALNDVEKSNDQNRSKSVSALNAAMDDTQKALMALPDWTPGHDGPETTATTAPGKSNASSSSSSGSSMGSSSK